MKEHLTELVRAAPTPAHGRNVAREYLQARILGSLQRTGAMIPLAFHGGTALRFLYASPRYSEGLDFALERARSQYDFRIYLRAIQSEFTREGYAVELKVSDRKVVHSAFVRLACTESDPARQCAATDRLDRSQPDRTQLAGDGTPSGANTGVGPCGSRRQPLSGVPLDI
jgi:predicted nucleotidyltransferase component of viral defense system